MSYASIVITKHATNVWFAKDNTLPGGVAGHFVSGWSGGVNSDQFTLKSKNGGIVYNNQPWSIFSYVDNLDSGNNFTPTSAVDLVVKLTQRDFFEYSSSGGAGVDTWLQLLDVLIGSYAGRANQVVVVAPSEAGLTTVTPSFAFQNNRGKSQNFTKSGSMWINNIGMANYVNENVTINVAEDETPILLRVQNTTAGVTTQYLYFFFAGKGVWGEGGEETGQSNFFYITERRLTVADVADTPNSETFDLGDTTGEDFWEVANLQDPPFDLNDSGDLDIDGNPRTYFFSFTNSGDLYIAKFGGAQGYYGVDELQFVEGDFVVITNSTVTPTPNLSMVTGVGNTTPDPMVSNDPVNGNKVSREANGEVYTDSDGNTITVKYPDSAAAGDAIYNEPVKTGEQVRAMLSDIAYVIPEQFGAVGDGVTDDSAAIQAAYDSGIPVCIPENVYLISDIDVSNPGFIFGFGSGSVLKTTTNSTMLDVNASRFGMSFVKLEGSGRGSAGNYLSDNPNQYGVKVEGFYFHNVFSNILYENFGGAGFYGKDNSDGSSSTVMNGVIHNNCHFISCLYGCLVDTLFEYNLFNGCNWEMNEYGIEIKAGNNSITGGSIITNRTGLKLSTGTNDGHSVVSGTTINHNLDYGIDGNGIVNGHLFSNCVIYFNAIRIVSCTDIVFDGGLHKSSPFTITNCTRTVICNNKFATTPTFSITGDSPRFFNNSYPGTIPAAAAESIEAMTNTGIFNINGLTAAAALQRIKIAGTIRFSIGSDEALTAGLPNNLNVYVHGNNSMFLSTNNVKRLTISGAGLATFSNNVALATAPTTSAGTYDILTRNTSTGAIEKIVSTTFVSDSITDGVTTIAPSQNAVFDALALKAPLADPTFTTNVTSPKFTLSALNTAPSSASDTGTTGEIRIDASYIYVCVATNTWVRSPLTTW